MGFEMNLNEHGIKRDQSKAPNGPFDQAGMTFLETILDFHFHF